MSRHLVVVATRPLQQTLLRTSTIPILPTTPASRTLLSAFSTLRSQTRRGPRSFNSSFKSYSTYQNATAQNIKVVGLLPVASRLSARNSTSSPFARLSPFESISCSRTQKWRLQKRLRSDRKAPDEGILGAEAAKSSKHNAEASEASKAGQQHAVTGVTSKTLLDRLPHLHRPTKTELLATASSFWQRLGIHFKWFSIRSFRPYQLDEIGAFVSWVFLGHLVWIVIGTTTFVSLAIWALNTVFAQETLAGWVGNYLTKSSGVKVVFESAIVPTWKDGVITFHNVFVSRRPGQLSKKERSVSKGSSITAAAAAETAFADKNRDVASPEDDGNYSQFDVKIDAVNVTLSFSKWFNGKGLLQNVNIQGVRGVIDRTHVQRTEGYVDPKTYRHEHSTGDFEIDDFKMSDVLLTVHQPHRFRPFTVSVFNCDLPRLRKQWLFYDFMSANNMSGSFDESLFTVHPRQVHGHTGAALTDGTEAGEPNHWKKHSRLRIDGLNIDHLNRGVEGTFSWIREGTVDLVADVMIPNDDDGVWLQSWRKSTHAVSDFYDRMEATVTSAQANGKMPEANSVVQNASDALEHADSSSTAEDSKRFVLMDIKVNLNDVRASVPLFTREISYVNNALVRPIVAYINSRRAFIPVNCRIVKRQSDFDGSWTVFDSGLLDDLSRETYDAIARDIHDEQARNRRIKKVGLWTIQLAAQALFIGLAGQLA